jgi:outer membrane scaffolding protein for murein synthesis (MipA/OmpV family)
MKNFLLLFLFFFSLPLHGKFTTGIGYIQPAVFQVDNEINPLPFGLSFVPMIAYRGERLSVFGPNISYALNKGPISLSLRLHAIGDRYEAYEVERKETAINAGMRLRLYFLSLSYTSDISRTYEGNIFELSLFWRFKVNEWFFVTPRYTKRFLNQAYTNYYYGVSEDEVGFFDEYSMNSAQNDIAALNLLFKLKEGQSLSLGASYRSFDPVIYDSPIINRQSFITSSVFWNFDL